MNVSLTPDLEKFVQSKVSTGRYQSSSEVVREALRLLEERDQERQHRLEALKADIQEGLKGSFREVDMDTIIAEAEAEMDKEKKAKANG